MNRKITAAVAFDTPERRVRIDASAQKLGFEVHWVENGKVTAEDVQDCEIFFGMLPPELLQVLPPVQEPLRARKPPVREPLRALPQVRWPRKPLRLPRSLVRACLFLSPP